MGGGVKNVINGRYRIRSPLGTGGMGTVFLAEDRARGNTLVALKQVTPGGTASESKASADALIREFETLARLRHPHLPAVHDFGSIEKTGNLYISMDYIEGRDLLEAAASLGPEQILALVAQVCRALEFIHTRGLVHRDVKPENILVTRPEETEPRAYLVDFGLTSSAREGGAPSGTLHYVAPEILRGEAPDRRADLYALGVVLYRLSTGRCPYEGTAREVMQGHLEGVPPAPGAAVASEAPAPLRPLLGEAFASVILRLIEKDPSRRYRSAAETLGALNRATGSHHPVETAETGFSYTTWAPLVGREKELAAVDALVERLVQRPIRESADRRGALVVVQGEAGSGKTRFLSESKRRAQVRGILSALVTCGAGTPAFQPIAEAISLLGAAETPLPPPGGFDTTSSEKARLRAADAAFSSLAARAESSPVALFLDDAHLADEGTAAVCEAIARNASGVPGLQLVLAYRPEELEGSPLSASLVRLKRAARIEEISLRPLDLERTAEMLRGMLGLAEAPADLAALVHRETSGNPFYVEEAVRSLIEEGAISRVDLSFRADVAALTTIAFPAGVGEAIRRRLARLSTEERRMLEALCVIGRPAERPLLLETAGLAASAMDEALISLRERSLVTDQATGIGPLYAITNARVRDHAYDGIDWERRRALHDAVASALKARSDGGENVRYEELARHAINGTDPQRALAYAMEAAQRCCAMGAGSDAVAFYRQALDLQPAGSHADRAEVLWRIGLIEADTGRDAQAMESLDQSLRAAGSAARRDLSARARLEKASLHARRGRPVEALREVERAQEILSAEGDQVLVARAHSIMARVMGRAGKVDRALEAQGRALAAAEKAGDPGALASALNNLAAIFFFMGRHEEAIETLERSIRVRGEMGDRSGVIEPTNNLGLILAAMGHAERAIPRLEQSAALARSVGDLQALAEIQINLGDVHAALGSYDLASGCFEEAVAVASRIGDEPRACNALDAWGAALRTLGDLEAAAERHTQALERARRASDPVQELYALASLALDRAAAADLDAARDALRRAGRLSIPAVPPRARVRLLHATALTHLAAGAAREAASAAREMIQAASAERLGQDEAQGRLVLGLALAADGDAGASEALALSAERAGALRLDEVRWRALAARAAVMEKGGEREPAAAARAEAASILDALAARMTNEEVRARYLASPERVRLRSLAGSAAGAASALRAAGAGPLLAIYRISEIITSAADLDDLLAQVLDVALQIVRAERGLIILLGGDGEHQEVRAARGVEPETIADALEYSRSVVREAAAGRTVITYDAEADEKFRRYKSVSLFRIKSLACVPMKVRDRVLGTVYLDSRLPGTFFHEEELEFLKAFANLAGSAIEMARLNARLSSENVTLQREVQDLRKAAGRRTRYQSLVGKAARMQAVYDMLDRVSASNLPILITGESGTGKELAARAIHFGGARKDRKFFSENVAAIPATLLESELFGHVRGAFTGADRDRKGVFELASGGTLFLDEIGDMSLPLQSKLLRALQEGEIRPVGGKDSVKVDVRIISATNRDLETMMKDGLFREDLYYRLNVVRISIPPLRERKEDIPMLVEHFLDRIAESTGAPRKRMDIGALQLLLRYDWPGNVRELENEIMKLAVLTPLDVITQQDLTSHRELLDKLTRLESEGEAFPSLLQTEKRQIERALAEAGGNRARAAELLGISRATIYRKIREYRLSA